MKVLSVSKIDAELDQVREWFSTTSLEYFSVLAHVHPEERFTLDRKPRKLDGTSQDDLRFALDARRRSYEEIDGQWEEVAERVPNAVLFEISSADEGGLELRALVADRTGVEEKLEGWLVRVGEQLMEDLSEDVEHEEPQSEAAGAESG